MEKTATFSEIEAYLATVPAASGSWVEGLYTMNLTLRVIRRLVESMAADAASPLRVAEEGIAAREVRRVQQERGMHVEDAEHSGRVSVRLSAVLSPGDQSRLLKLVGAFTQPVFRPVGRFSSNGHSVANAARRCCSTYLFSRIVKGATILEAGPDERNWLLAADDNTHEGASEGRYRGARPILGPRDAVRAAWKSLARAVSENRKNSWTGDQQVRANLLLTCLQSVFPRAKVQDIVGTFEYLVSGDANYDIAFGDMPDVMCAVGARTWLGYMTRAKGVTRSGGPTTGTLDLMGTNYRVDRRKDLIRFSQVESSAFGYDHRASQYLLYEEHNGYVWAAHGYHYVYTKMPETNSELLFFSVVRVPTVVGLQEPRYVENECAGMLEVRSVWAVGDDVSGVPTSFERVRFHVDKVNFHKVLEKRRALDFKGSLAATLSLVRSTNVRFWLNGVPVSAVNRTASRLSEAVAVAVEVLAAEGRLATGMTFEKAMGEFRIACQKDGLMMRWLAELFDMRAVFGKVARPVCELWSSVRSVLADAAISPLADLVVAVAEAPDHIRLDSGDYSSLDKDVAEDFDSQCLCARLSDARVALAYASGQAREDLAVLVDQLASSMPCIACAKARDEVVFAMGREPEAGVPETDTASDRDSDDTSVWDNHDSESSEGGSAALSATTLDEVSDCGSDRAGFGSSWRDVVGQGMVEADTMQEGIELESHLIACALTEARVNATRVLVTETPRDRLIAELSTTRVRHAAVKVEAGRVVRVISPEEGDYGAVYDMREDRLVPVKRRKGLMMVRVPDGWYYSSSQLRVWNGPDIIAAISYAMDYGRIQAHRGFFRVTLGVPGAGKTREMVEKLSKEWGPESHMDLVLCVTNAAVEQAQGYGRLFGLPKDFVEKRFMTLDRYLIHVKTAARVLCIDEFPMQHASRVDAAVTIARPKEVRVTGDAKQIQYDPFCATFTVQFSRLGGTVPSEHIRFLAETHRLNEDACAAFVDQYPSIYPCSCCRVGMRQRKTLSWKRVHNLGAVRFDPGTRLHVYKQDEKEDVRVAANLRDNLETLRRAEVGGLSSVGEDQGSTHSAVHTIRTTTTYDKAAVVKKQSLFNRVEFVLTDMTRHTESYEYTTMADEQDEVIRRIEMSRDPGRLAAVRARRPYADVTLASLLE